MQCNRQYAWCLVAVLALVSCTQSYKPDVSTETGNPPAIEADLIALVVTRDEVHVRGEAGAVTPPEGEVEITIMRTQDVTTGQVEDNGSFDVQVDATLDDVFEVRAVQNGMRSPAAIVVRGGAQVGEGDGGTLSCEQKETLARTAYSQALASADKSCATKEDCVTVWEATDCFSGCSRGLASEAGLASIEAAVQELNGGLCDGYEDECGPVLAQPCVGPLPALCEGGQCVEDDGTSESLADCTSAFDSGPCDAAISVRWHDPATGACVVQSYGGCEGNDNRYDSLEACQAACPPPSAQSDCGAGRTLISTCLECGPLGPCLTQYPVCAKQCESDADCEEEHGVHSDATFCDLATKICVGTSPCL